MTSQQLQVSYTRNPQNIGAHLFKVYHHGTHAGLKIWLSEIQRSLLTSYFIYYYFYIS